MCAVHSRELRVAQLRVHLCSDGEGLGGLRLALDGPVQGKYRLAVASHRGEGHANGKRAAIVVGHTQLHKLTQVQRFLDTTGTQADMSLEGERGAIIGIGRQHTFDNLCGFWQQLLVHQAVRFGHCHAFKQVWHADPLPLAGFRYIS